MMRLVAFVVAVLFGVGALQAVDAVSSPTPAHAANVSCVASGSTAQNGYTEAPSHGQVMYIDSGVTPKIDAAYVGYRITNSTGSTKSIWVQLDNFTGGKVGLANPKDSFQELPNLASGSTATAFFLLKAIGSTTSAQTHTMKVFEQRPDISGVTAKFTCDFTFVKVAETIKASANKIGNVSSTLSPSTATLGGTLAISIDNSASTKTGTLGNGSSPDFSAFWASPAAYSSWPTRALRLEKTTITISCQTGADIVLNNMLFVSDTTAPANNTLANCIKSGQGSQWYATYTFRIIGPGPASVTPSPVANIASGTQYKHSDVAGVSFTYNGGTSTTITGLNNISAATAATVKVSAATSGAGNGTSITIQYTVTITSDAVDPAGVQVDEVVDTHASGTSYVSGSTSTKLGISSTSYAAAGNPQTLAADASLSPPPAHFIGPYGPINTTHTQYLQYSYSIPCNGTTYKNTVVAYTGDVVIGSSSTAASAITVSAASGSGTCGTPTITTTTTSFDPTATTNPADTVTSNSANINGIFNASGTTGSQYQFAYSTDPNLATGVTTTTLTSLTAGSTSNTSAAASISSLAAGTVYYYQARVQNASGKVFYGAILSFVTLQTQAAPTVTTNAASGIGATAATLNGTVSPNGTAITGVYFYFASSSALSGSTTTLAATSGNQYAVQTDVGTTTPTSGNLTFAANTFGTQAFNSHSITSVQKDFSAFTGTIYFQTHITCTVVAVYCPNGYVDGAVLSFVLGSATATTTSATAVGATSATINGTVNNNGLTGPTNISFCYGTSNTSSLGQLQGSCTSVTTPTPSTATGSLDTTSSYSASGLTSGTVYYYQIIATVSSKTTYGSILSFTTLGITTATLPDGTLGNAYSASLAGTGGSTTYTWSATGLPTGLSISPGGVISGSTTVSGPATVVVTMTDASSGLTTTKTYTINFTGPSTSTSAASGITASAATLNGSVNLNSVTATSINLCWGTDATMATCTNPINIASQVTAATGANTVSSTVSSGLTAGTTYYYKIVVAYSGGSLSSNITSFIPIAGPVATTTAATIVSSTSATMNGTVVMNGYTATSSKYCWGTDPALAGCTAVDTLSQTSSTSATNTLTKTLTGLTPGTTYYYEIVVGYGTSSTATSNITSFIPKATPTTTTTAATGVTSSSATINGTVDLGGNSGATATFCWGTSSTLGTCTNLAIASPATLSISASNTVSASISSGLTAGTTYYYQIVVSYGTSSTVTSNITSFVPSSTPTTTTTAATSISNTSATINGTVNLNGTTGATATFCWGTAALLGTCTNLAISSPASLSVSASNTVSATIASGLTAGTTYYYKIVVSYGTSSTVTSNITSFIPTSAPTVTTSVATGVTSTTGTFNGVVTLNGNTVTSANFCWGTSSSLSTCDSIDVTSQVSSVSSANTITQLVTTLSPNNTYYYQLVVVTSAGTITSSPIIQFSTAYATTNTVTNVGLSTGTLNGTLYAGSTAIGNGAITSVKLCYSTSATLTSGVLDTAPTCSGNLWTTGTMNVAANGSLSFTYNATVVTPPQTFQSQMQVVFATTPAVVANGSVVPFTTLNTPDVAVNNATSISSKGARIHGLVYPKGNRLSKVSFCYYETSLGTAAQICLDPVSTTDLSSNAVGWNGTSNTGSTDYTLSNLKPHTNYTYYIQANAQASSFATAQTSAIRFRAADLRFRTAAVSPTVQSSTTSFTTAGAETFAATGITTIGATLNGTLYAPSAGLSSTDVTDVRICYNTDGTLTNGAMSTATCATGLWGNAAVAANGNVTYAPAVTGLLAGTKYFFQIQVTFADGATAYGSVQNFTTTQLATATTNAATSISATGATLNGSFNANGGTVNSVTICYDTVNTFTTCANPITIAAPAGGWVTGSNSISTTLSNLPNHTLYYFTVVVNTSIGTTTAASLSFTTKSVVTFDSQGAGSYASQQYAAGGSITDPGTPSKSGYTFTGWYTANTGGTRITFPYNPTGTANFTLYAQWTADAHTLFFNVDGGSAVNSKTFYSDGSVDITDVSTKAGYTFLGWFSSTGSSVALTSPYTPGVYTNVTIYAKWQAISYNVTYNANGTGATGGSTGTYTTGSTLVQPTNPSRPGYTFAGWYDATTGGTAANFTTAQTGTGALVYYAHWTADAHTLNFNVGGGSAVNSKTFYSDGSVDITDVSTKAGYTFLGWFTSTGSTVALTSPYSPGVYTDATIYAKWQAIVYNVIYDANGVGATGGSTSTYTTGSTLVRPADPTRPGYSFLGWFDATTAGTAANFTTAQTGTIDLHFYAQWQAYTTSFQYANGTSTNLPNQNGVVTLPDGTGLTVPANSYFSGWACPAGTSTLPANSTFTPTSNTICVAVFSLNGSKTVTFNSNYPGTSPTNTTSTQTANSSTQLSPNPFSVTGYRFVQWSVGTSSATSYKQSTDTYDFSANLQLFAQWAVISYDVTFDPNGGSATPNGSYTVTTPVNQPANPSRNGYTFLGWNTSAGTPVTWTAGGTYQPSGTGPITLTAQWSHNTSTVTFNSNFPSGTQATHTQSSNVSGTALDAPTFSLTGYRFVQWSIAGSSPAAYMQSTDTYDFLADRTLDAVWAPITYAVTFNPDWTGGTHINDASYSVLTPANEPTAPTRAGYTFLGWSTITGPIVSWTSGTWQPGTTGTIDLHAHWLRNNATITFNSNYPTSAALTPATHTQTSNGFAVALDAPTFTVSGYTFDRWYVTTATGPGTMLSTDTYDFGSDLQLYAKWIPNTYAVNYFGQQATSPTHTTGTYVTAGSVALTGDPGYTGYTFLGWSASTNGALVAAVTATSYLPGTIGVLNLYAQWSLTSYTVTFDPQGGTSVPSATYTMGGSIAAPTVTTTLSGSTFNGWFAASTGGSALVFPYSPGTTGPITLYAQWTATVHNVTFALGSGGGTPATGTAPASTNTASVTLPGQGSMVAPTGYVFTGWVCPTGTTLLAGAVITPSGNITCTAVWSSITAKTVTFHSNYPFGTNTTTVQTGTAPHALAANPFVAGGYNFVGWSTTPTGTKSWDNLDVYDFSADKDLYAVWQVIPLPNNPTPVYQILFVYQGGTPGVTVTYYSPGEPPLPLPSTAKPGYTFAGWSTAPTEPQIVNAPFTTHASVTLFALWVAKTITITFNYLGGTTGIHSMSYTVGQPGMTGLPSSTKQGYDFAGWSEVTGGSTAVTEPYSPLEDLTLYAIWNGTKYTVTLMPQNGAPIKMIYTVGGDPLQLPDIGTKKNLYAVGWAPNEHPTEAVPNPYRPNRSVTLYPLWLIDRLKTPLYFSGDSSVLDAKAKAILKATAQKIVAANLNPTLVVDGWVKATLDTSYDLKLSQARAVQTVAYLRSLGINAFAKLTPKGIAPQNNPTARRVDLAVYLGGPKVKK